MPFFVVGIYLLALDNCGMGGICCRLAKPITQSSVRMGNENRLLYIWLYSRIYVISDRTAMYLLTCFYSNRLDMY